ncbi:MAG: ATP-grasp domain-containing protein [Candidatus Eisenbacteria bacterium]
MRIAVVRNRRNEGVVARFGVPTAEKYGRTAVQGVVDALRRAGHQVAILEGDGTLFARLAEFMPADPGTGAPTGMVFNMSYGVQGECRYVHVPGLLEMAGVPYTGSSPRGHAACLDKVVTKLLIAKAGVATPRFCTMWGPADFDASLGFPLIVKPRHESTSLGLALVHDRSQLDAAVANIVATYGQDALVEEYVDGREVAIGLLGNDPPTVLPIVELDFRGRSSRIVSKGDKFHKTDDEPEKLCPAPLDPALERELHALAHKVWRACGCRDYARIDVRIGLDGRPSVLEINSMASLGAGGSYMRAATTAGFTFDSLIAEIVDRAHLRCFGTPAPRDPIAVPDDAQLALATELED